MMGDAGAAEDGRRYPRHPRVGVGVVLFRGDAVLLVRRARPPLLGAWSFPGGAQELGETVEAAARRELREETGLEAGTLALAAHVDAIHRDEAGRILFHYTILDLAGFAAADEPAPRAAGDVSAARFVAVKEIEAYPLDAGHVGVLEAARRVVAQRR